MGSILVAVLMRINSADKYLAASPIDAIHTLHCGNIRPPISWEPNAGIEI